MIDQIRFNHDIEILLEQCSLVIGHLRVHIDVGSTRMFRRHLLTREVPWA